MKRQVKPSKQETIWAFQTFKPTQPSIPH